jgi:hypothetical protein
MFAISVRTVRICSERRAKKCLPLAVDRRIRTHTHLHLQSQSRPLYGVWKSYSET